MSFCISQIFLFKIFLQSFSKIYSGLIGNTHYHPKHIGQFICNAYFFFIFLKRLLAKFSHHQARKFAYFFHQNSKIGKFVKIPNTGCSDPFINI